ncbi:hypothetical protein ACFPT7_03005 [Acidicapsa dinghuensis]|uniref:Glycosyltransferase RgtA/B/C/D-like domain-containing protein n=1 Tax=Acidicapsa dinghuensis TaxID=2218256 RepID=A0ABW1EA95_9BACT|nr:hypothetical protein [Acidicapsa dinghuensis]
MLDVPPINRFKIRDLCIAIFLFAATALWTLWQNSRVAVLWDLGYLLNTSHRIAVGQIPYRDFSLVHPPITFFVQAVIEHIFGRHYEYVVAYAAFAGGVASLLTWWIIREIVCGQSHAWLISLLLTLPLPVLGIYSIYPHPIYDADSVLAILAAILLLYRAAKPDASWKTRTVAGASCALPLFVKQNIGLPFLLAVLVAAMLLLAVRRTQRGRKTEPSHHLSSAAILQIAGGALAALAVVTACLAITCGLRNYIHWTVQFAAQRRLPAANTLLSLYGEPSLVWALPSFAAGIALLFCRPLRRAWIHAIGVCLATIPFAATLVCLLLEPNAEDRADRLLALWPLLLIAAMAISLLELRKGVTFPRLIPFVILAAIHGTFLSQEVWGSTYAIWSLLILLAGNLLMALPARASRAVPALAAAMGVTLLVCGGFYAASLERLDYIYNSADEPLVRATLPVLHGMAARGTYLPDFEQLVRFADAEIPASDGILLLPGEEPFFYVTGRVPRFPVVLFDHTTDPYTPEELFAEVKRLGVRWVVMKTRLQSNEDPLLERAQIMQQIEQQFQLVRKLDGYDVYYRR